MTNKTITRISRNEMHKQILETVAKRSTCTRAHVGAALIVKDGRIISMGYAGSPSGTPHCIDAGCVRGDDGGCIRTIHAEANAIAFAAKGGISTDGCVMYTTISPCYNCAKLIINSGITAVYYLEEYRKTEGIYLLHDSNIISQIFHGDK
jgi:dCMP deaminase